MERFLCLDCTVVGPITKHGYCSTCGSSVVVSEHTHQTQEMWPGYYAWLIDAKERLEEIERAESVTFSVNDSKILAGMGIKV